MSQDKNLDREGGEKSKSEARSTGAIGARMPCGTVVTNVYEAYEAGKRASQPQAGAAVPSDRQVSDIRDAAAILEREGYRMHAMALRQIAAGATPAPTDTGTKQAESGVPLVIELGHGRIEVGQGHQWVGDARLPAILFGRNGAGAVGIETEGDRTMEPGECIAAITFTNRASLDVVAEKLAELRTRIWPEVADTCASGAGEVKTWRERLPADPDAQQITEAMHAEIADLRVQLARLQAPVGDQYNNATHDKRMEFLEGERAQLAQLKAPVGESKPTDLSKRLRASAARPTVLSDSLRADLISAADEIDRYYGGMLAWKRTAEAKDRDFVAKLAEVREHQQRELAAAIHYPDCWDTAAYPTVESALRELYGTFKCSTEECPAAQPEQGDAVRDQALEEAAKICDEEICACCWEDDAQAAAEHLAERIRSLRATNTEGKDQQ